MKILILGAAGMLGHKMAQILNQEFPGDVYAMIRRPKSSLAPFGLLPESHIFDDIDLQDFNELTPLLERLRPRQIINCVGITLRKPDHRIFEKNLAINAMLPHRLALWCARNQSRIIHFSTDCVFDGRKGNYLEDDQPTAEDVYGQTKFLGEVRGPSALTLRLSIIGRELFEKTELLEWFLSQKGRTIRGYSEVYYSGLSTEVVAKEVARIIKNYPQLTGLFHLASEKISKFQLLSLANEIFSNQVTIEKDSSKKSDKSLNCDLYQRTTGFLPPKWPDMLKEIARPSFL